MKRSGILILILLAWGQVYSETCVPVAGRQVNLRSGPGIQHRAVASMSYGEAVEILYSAEESVEIGGIRDRWYRIKTERADEQWIFGAFLAMPDRFTPVVKMKPRDYSFCVGDWCPSISFHSNGKASILYRLCLGADCTEKEKRDECASLRGSFILHDARHYGESTCTTTRQVLQYREVYRVDDMHFVNLYSNSPCVFGMNLRCLCVNRE